MSSKTLPIPGLKAAPGERVERVGTPPSVGLRAPTAATYWRTLRHLRWSQLGYLALRRVLPSSNSPAKMDAPVGLRGVSCPCRFLDWQPEASRKMIATREFTFLNQTVADKASIPWNDRKYAKLWLYHLNYFDFLNVGFALPKEAPMLKVALAIVWDWCRRNTQGTEVGWEPYPLSLRIINWLKFLARHGQALEVLGERGKIDTLLESLDVQVATLERRLEKDLLGNHFLKNIKALLFAGALLETSRSARWRAKGRDLLEQELNEQILPDGGHFERSPMYHAQILNDLAEIRLLCAATGQRLSCSDLLSQKIRSMAQFLQGILHPDGEIPLFNDSALGGASPPAKSLTLAEAADTKGFESVHQVKVFPDSGYGVIRSLELRSTLIFDCGPLGPDYQPGHGHCDVLSYELSLHGQRVVVDTGVSTYEPCAERRYERSTAAHNTVRIDGEDQAEIWASFRVGRRPKVGRVAGGETRELCFVRGEHYAYQHRGVIHSRMIVLTPRNSWVVVDSLGGNGNHLVESFIHFHPAVRVENVNNPARSAVGTANRRWAIQFGEYQYFLTTLGPGELMARDSWYAPEFGMRMHRTTLHWSWEGDLPVRLIYTLTPIGERPPLISQCLGQEAVEVDNIPLPLS